MYVARVTRFTRFSSLDSASSRRSSEALLPLSPSCEPLLSPRPAVLTGACTAHQAKSKARGCKTVRLTRDQPVIHIAAAYGTNPLILQRDNPQLDRLVRAISVTAVGLLALRKGSTLAVRPAEGDERRRWNPSGQPRKGGGSVWSLL
jgi:hypothetical protein